MTHTSPERAEVSVNHKMGVKRAYESKPVAASRAWVRAFGEGTDSAEGENEPVNRTNHGWWWPLIAERRGVTRNAARWTVLPRWRFGLVRGGKMNYANSQLFSGSIKKG